MKLPDSQSKPTLSFKDAAIHSGLVSARRWRSTAKNLGTTDESKIAEALVQTGILTDYQAQQLRSGRTKFRLGAYLITDWIGQGGMGQVYKAVHSVMGREVAVKTLPLEKLTSQSYAAFIREIRLQAGLDSPYVVRAYDAGQEGKVHFLVTEYVPGTDLRRLVRSNSPLTMNHAALVISQAALGLQYAHDLGLVHRDVKPGNILVTPDGHAKVSDIGLAAYSFNNADDPRAGKIVGTADYLSPEQIRTPSDVGPLSDIYSLGCTVYYVVTGKVPFPGGDSKSKCKRHCEQTPWHPRKFCPDLSEDFVDVLADMMEKDPSKRIQSAAEVAERLEPWSAHALDEVVDRPIHPHSWTPPPPPKEPAQHSESSDGNEGSNSGGLQSGSMGAPAFDTAPQQSTDPSARSSQSRSGRAESLMPPMPGGLERGDTSPGKTTQSWMPIALALAIAIPISLLIGAIIGYLLNEG